MPIDPISGFASALSQDHGNDPFAQVQRAQNQEQGMTRQEFGAAVVAKTLDYMNGQADSSMNAPMTKQEFGAAVVSKTLNYMNSGSNGNSGMAQDYDFQKSVLGTYAAGKGALTSIKA